MTTKCKACSRPAEATVVLKIIPKDVRIPITTTTHELCWDHVADPGPILGMSRPKEDI